MMNPAGSCGASPQEWQYTDALGDDIRYIVPIVSNPGLPGIGSLLRIQKTRGKIPSVKDSSGRVMCLSKWQVHDTTPAELNAWEHDSDYGYGFRTGHGGYIAVDCDIDDWDICSAVRQLLADAIDINWREVPLRTHGKAPRWASIIRIEGIDTLPKHVLKWTDDSGNKIEFLGTGQQLACAGRHPSGDNYRWSCPPFPAKTITQNAFKEFIQSLRDNFPIELEKNSPDPVRVKGKTFVEIDRVADWLRDTGRVIGTGPEGQLFIECPWCDAHTMSGGPGETCYFPVGSNGYLGGGFKCLHAHCADKTTADFLAWARSQGFEQTAADDYPDETESERESEPLKPAGKDAPARGGLPELIDIVESDKSLKGIRLNDFCNMIEFTAPVPWNPLNPAELPADGRYFIRDTDYAQFRLYIETTYGMRFRVADYTDAFNILAQRQHYHPIKDFIRGLPVWDNVPRVDTLLHDYLGADDNIYTREVMRKTLCAAILRIYRPGVKFDTMPVLNGPQGIGKSTLLARLGGEWFNDNVSLLGTRDKSAAEGLQMSWLVELSEVDGGLRRSDLESVKAFLSRTIDVYRPAYGRTVEKHPRQCVFFGTANSENGYLSDLTGNRRFLNVRCKKDSEKHPWDLTDDDIRQIWAEVKFRVSHHESLILSAEAQKIAEREQDQALETDEREGIIMRFCDLTLPGGWQNWDINRRTSWLNNPIVKGVEIRHYVCILEIWCECLGQSHVSLKKSDSIKIGATLLKHGWKKAGVKPCGPYAMQRVYVNPHVV